MDHALKVGIRGARVRFVAMAASYSLGLLNDNLFKQAAMLIAVGTGHASAQGYATVVFALPFLLFAAPAGWLADRFSKRRIVVTSKAAELVASVIGAVGVCRGSIPLMLLMLWIMATQATIFNPALCGSIPELYPERDVMMANAVLRIAVTMSVLIGIALAGFALARTGPELWGVPHGRMLVAVTMVGIALVGLAASFGVPHRPPAGSKRRFPWDGPIATLRDLYGARTDPLLALTLAADLFIWFSGSLQVLTINRLGLSELKMSESWTSGMVVAQLVGVAAGGVLGGKIATGRSWCRLIAPAASIMAVLMMLVSAIPLLPEGLRPGACLVLIGGIGLFGGVVLIPCESFIQVRPTADRKGAVISAGNFVAYAGILLSGPAANLMLALDMPPSASFGVLGMLSLVAAVGFWVVLRFHRIEEAERVRD